MAVALESAALGLDQSVQIVREADELGRIFAGQAHALAGLHFAHLALEPSQRQQHEREQSADHDQHRERDPAEPSDQLAPERRLPLVIRFERDRDRERIRRRALVRELPFDAHQQRVERRKARHVEMRVVLVPRLGQLVGREVAAEQRQ